MLNQIKCPICSEDVSNAHIGSVTTIEQLDTKRRTVYGHCLHCDSSFELEQFFKDNEWVTTRYRRYVLKPQAWQQVAEIPVPPVVGIGGFLSSFCEDQVTAGV